MGAGFSDLLDRDDGRTTLGDVPESCAASILVCLDPPEICRLAGLNRAFRGASWADFVWETKLPSNYKFLVEKVLGDKTTPEKSSRKEIYSRLCAPNCFADDENKMVWLEKSSGKVCVLVSYKAMRITGIDDRRYWTHIPSDESRPSAASKQFIGGRRVSSSDQVHGWDKKPVRFQLSTSNGRQTASSERYLAEQGSWAHYRAGEFTVDSPDVPTKIKFSMMQIDCTHTKGGLCLDSVLVCPKELGDGVMMKQLV
ncbi:unnamed protein product [Linum tenue]|uniref:F-box domain-containing protein n=1 Tax=Linum tenue TaxID=586396 RepID=A0AAV0NYW1_9ROSI|nr:unnamed protein product [Linum tenue]